MNISGGDKFSAVAFTGGKSGKKQLVVVLVNDRQEQVDVKSEGAFGQYSCIIAYETSANADLLQIAERAANTAFTLTLRSVTTIVFSE
ncbi:MAG: hypothetical protein J1E43_07915 [Christensenellaceae bacterium]|nr:hypothetical protein [Christensenellaceae bacterium]